MSGRLVICAFKPKPGMDAALSAVIEKHWWLLKDLGLVTDRPRYAMRSTDGTIVEVFEWKSPEAIATAHETQAVLDLWKEYEAACDYVPLASVPEAANLFSEFEPIPFRM